MEVNMSVEVKLLLDTKSTLGEGAIWSSTESRLYWIDIDPGDVHIYNPATGEDRVVNVGQMVGTVVPAKSGGVMLAVHHGFAHLDLVTKKMTVLADPEAHLSGNRFNDGKCDPAGRFWAGTMSIDESIRDAGSLYFLEPTGKVHKMLEKVSVANGIVWSLDRKIMYYIDTPTFEVAAFDYDLATGAIANRRTAVRVPGECGAPDGMTIDAEGMLWVAHWGGSCVCRWDPITGKLLTTIKLPAAQVTSCAFGGPDLDVLYITTARRGLSPAEVAQQPLAGGLFSTRPGVKGIPAEMFG
jgi:sugar lactone lactonase YvrE